MAHGYLVYCPHVKPTANKRKDTMYGVKTSSCKMKQPKPSHEEAKEMKNKSIVTHNVEIVIGADVHTKKHVVRVKIGDEYKKATNIAPNQESWISLLRPYAQCDVTVVYESGPNGFCLHDMLLPLAPMCRSLKVIMAPASQIPVAPGSKRVKTDRRDTTRIIMAYEMGAITPVVVPEPEQREERALTRLWDQLKKKTREVKNQIHGFLKSNGIEYPDKYAGAPWSDGWIATIKDAAKAASKTGGFVIALRMYLDEFSRLQKQEKELRKRIEALGKTGRCAPVARRLVELKGIGMLSAARIACEVADFAAFKNSDAFASYTGLVPGEHSSGDTVHHGHITKTGNRRLRTIFVEGAWMWLRYDPEARRIFHRIAAGKKERACLAIVALARRLAVMAYHAVLHPAQEQQAA
jgi:transposase